MIFVVLCTVVLKKFVPVLCDIGLNSRTFENSYGYSSSGGYPPAGYSYPQPSPPVNLDEPSPPLYLPPSGLPPSALPPIFNDEVPLLPGKPPVTPTYLPPVLYPPLSDAPIPPPSDDSVVIPAIPPSQGYLPPSGGLYQSSNPHVRILNMSCMADLNFKCVFKMESQVSPVLEEGTEDCMTQVSNNQFQIDLNSFGKMLKCGVKKCKSSIRENMCLMVRIPTAKGIRLPEDEAVTFVCSPQEKIVSHTKHLKLSAKNLGSSARARSNTGFIATGGAKKDLKSRVHILRRNKGGQVFDQSVQQDSVIQLGEELVLRAIIDEMDGWKNSLMGPVLISSASSKKSAILVNQNGCVSPQMKHVCPRSPKQLTPLDTELRFRAFLFEEAPQGDEMIVSVRMQGCLHPQDCFRTENCETDNAIFAARTKRQAFDNAASNEGSSKSDANVTNWESSLYFKVIRVDKNKTNFIETDVEFDYLNWFYMFLFSIILLVMAILLCFQIIPRYKQ